MLLQWKYLSLVSGFISFIRKVPFDDVALTTDSWSTESRSYATINAENDSMPSTLSLYTCKYINILLHIFHLKILFWKQIHIIIIVTLHVERMSSYHQIIWDVDGDPIRTTQWYDLILEMWYYMPDQVHSKIICFSCIYLFSGIFNVFSYILYWSLMQKNCGNVCLYILFLDATSSCVSSLVPCWNIPYATSLQNR